MNYFLPEYWNEKRQSIALGVVAFLLFVGFVGSIRGLSFMLLLTPILLTIILALMIVMWQVHLKNKLLIIGSIFLGGFIIEQIGVHSALLFGHYSYGSPLGVKLFGVPILIGLTWCIVTLSAWHIVAFGKQKLLASFVMAGALVVMLDLILEQFAIVYGFWTWRGNEIPLYNYVSWFMVSQICFYVYYRFAKKAPPSIFIAGILPLLGLFFWCMLIAK